MPQESPLTPLLRRQDGVISRRQALGHLTARTVEWRLASRRWQAPSRGVYVTHSGPLTAEQRRWVAVLAAGAGRLAVLGGLSALETAGLRGFRSGQIHVLLPAATRCVRPPPEVLPHRTTHLPAGDIRRGPGPPATVPARALVDAAQWAYDDGAARAIVAAGLQQRVVRPDDVRRVLARMTRAHRRSLISQMIEYALDGAHTRSEADFLRLCKRAGFPDPVMQLPRRDGSGRQRYLDAYFRDFALHVEIDGGYHMEVRQWWADMRRQNELWLPGDRVLRFPAWAVTAEAGDVIAQIRRALEAAGWRDSRR